MGWREPSRSHPRDVLASRAPWPAVWQDGSVPFGNGTNRIALRAYHGPFRSALCSPNLNCPGKSAATQLAGMEVRHHHGYVDTLGHSGEDLGEMLHYGQAFL